MRSFRIRNLERSLKGFAYRMTYIVGNPGKRGHSVLFSFPRLSLTCWCVKGAVSPGMAWQRSVCPDGETNIMNKAAPAAQDLARRLLAQEAGEGEQAATVQTTLRAVEKLRLHLSKL